MRGARCFGLASIAAIGVASTAAAQTTQPRPDFKWERPIAANGAGPRRLPVDVPLLAGVNADVTDLRLFDENGRETPYLLVFSPPVAPVWAGAAVLRVAPVDTPKVRQSGFEADLGKTVIVDRFRIDAIAGQPFLKRAQLEASGDRAHWTLLAAEATLFDLPDERLRQLELSFAAGPYRYFRITWDDTNSARVPLPTSVSARVVAAAPPSAVLRAPLAVERRPSEPGRSRYRVRLPGPHLPIVALTFTLGGGHVLRDVSVYEPRLAGTEAAPVLLGTGRLQRVVQGALVAASLDVAIRPPVEPQLDLVVEDGDNPPLEVEGVSAVFAEQPWIYFESAGTALVARYGARRLAAPRYDLEAVRDSLRTTINNVTLATWGDAHALAPDNNAPPATPSSVATVGAAVDVSQFTYVRTVPPGDPGLVMLPLDAHVLAHSAGVSGAFGDVRVIDTADQQVPYLVERVAEPLSLDLKITRLTQPPPSVDVSSGRRTVYRIDWPFERLPSPRLVIATSARVFERTLVVAAEREPNRYHRDRWLELLSRARWAHVDKDTPAGELTLPLSSVDSRELLLIVDEGDNMPLPVTAARLLLPAYRVRFFRERNATLRLVYGNVNLSPPRYDLALLAPEVLGVAATEISAGDEQSARAAASLPALVSPRLFWVALVLAVAVLLGLIVRLLKPVGSVRL